VKSFHFQQPQLVIINSLYVSRAVYVSVHVPTYFTMYFFSCTMFSSDSLSAHFQKIQTNYVRLQTRNAQRNKTVLPQKDGTNLT